MSYKKSFYPASWFACTLLIGLSGCQTLRVPTLPSIPTTPLSPVAMTTGGENNASSSATTHFSITGKIGVKTPKQSGSAFYAWAQDGDRFAIDLTGALGIGQTHIEGIPGKVSLNSAKTGLLEAETPEELLTRATGWLAPISYLPSWIEGRAAEPNSTSTKDAQNRLATLNEGGWDVTFSYNDQSTSKTPIRLVMNQVSPTDTAQSNRVILTIQHQETTGDSAASDAKK
ncbi:lipoprotein insertase outer membrane protein LolB [Aquirhabdus parva]|uniref:Outer-membrane lipoprotein LolB n=1 Tax=Aquirhabdus parva TaxID=2283318 RepID=A0A345P4U6_9GAMM|nr:outer membrane lipoprotein LolB [Aquirhabdus parva]